MPDSTLPVSRKEIDFDQVERYLAWLAHPVAQLAAIPPDRHGALRVANVRSVDDAVSFIKKNVGLDIYCAVNAPPDSFAGTTRRARSEDIEKPSILLLDFDPARHDMPPGRALLAAIGALPAVVNIDSKPVLLDSGRGAQVLLRCPDGDLRGTWEKIQAQFADFLEAYGCKLDSTFDAARLARVPGTVNYRTGRLARVIPIPEKLPHNLEATFAGTRPDLNDQSRSGYEMAAADALAKFEFDGEKIEALLLAYPFGRGASEHPSSRRGTARKALGAKSPSLGNPLPPEWIDGDELLRRLENFYGRFLVLPTGIRLVLALWTLGTWTFDLFKSERPDVFDSFPFVVVTSPTKRCGKTRLGEVLALLAARAQQTVAPTEAAIFRVIEQERPTMIVDEAEALRGRGDRAEAVRAILNAGNRRGVSVPRCVGDSHKLQRFHTYSPKVVIAIGAVPETIRDRSITVLMQRKSAGEKVTAFKHRRVKAEAEAFRKSIAVFIKQRTLDIQSVYDSLNIDFVEDREAESWEPLFAILNVADPSRIEELQKTALRLSSEKDKADLDESLSLRLLADIRQVWPGGQEKLGSAELLSRLRNLEDSPWNDPDLKFNQRRLARMLAPFGISSRQIRLGESTVKGYLREEAERSFGRYLPPDGLEVKQAKQNSIQAPLLNLSEAKPNANVSYEKNDSDPHKQRAVSLVSDKTLPEDKPATLTPCSSMPPHDGQSDSRRCCRVCGSVCHSDAAAFFHPTLFCRREGASPEVAQ